MGTPSFKIYKQIYLFYFIFKLVQTKLHWLFYWQIPNWISQFSLKGLHLVIKMDIRVIFLEISRWRAFIQFRHTWKHQVWSLDLNQILTFLEKNKYIINWPKKGFLPMNFLHIIPGTDYRITSTIHPRILSSSTTSISSNLLSSTISSSLLMPSDLNKKYLKLLLFYHD